MIDRLKAMYEELKELVESELGKEEVRFSCDLTDKKLKDCITEKAGKSEEELIAKDPQLRLLTSTVLNCLDFGLSACVKKEDFKISNTYKEAEFYVAKDDKGIWRLNSITVKCDPNLLKEERLMEIKNCLKFFKESCSKEQEELQIEVNVIMSE